MGKDLEVPRTILEEIWTTTMEVLKTKDEFNPETREKIHKLVKMGKINPNSIITALKE